MGVKGLGGETSRGEKSRGEKAGVNRHVAEANRFIICGKGTFKNARHLQCNIFKVLVKQSTSQTIVTNSTQFNLSLKFDISTVVQSHPEDVMLNEPRATLRFKHKCMRKAMWGIIISLKSMF